MTFDRSSPENKKIPQPTIEVEPGFDDFLPKEFRENPIKYFEEKGINIKSGEITHHTDGSVNEDPCAVKDLPVWKNSAGEVLSLVGKRVNIEKGQVQKTNDPFYEYKIMELMRQLSLPATRPIARLEQAGSYLMVMERAKGFRWVSSDINRLKENGFSSDDLKRIESDADKMMDLLSERFENAGIMRPWKLRDMVFDIDIENKKLISITPVDWERTKLDSEKINNEGDALNPDL